MAIRTRQPVVPVGPLSAGEYEAECEDVSAVTSAAGNDCDLWVFSVQGREVRRWTMHKGSQAVARHEQVTALGLPRAFRYSAAVGRRCLLTLGIDGPYNNVIAAHPSL